MVKASMDTRMKAVVLYDSGRYRADEVAEMYGVGERTIRRWMFLYRNGGFEALKPGSTRPKQSRYIPKAIESRIVRLKEKYPSWGAKRIKHQLIRCFFKNG